MLKEYFFTAGVWTLVASFIVFFHGSSLESSILMTILDYIQSSQNPNATLPETNFIVYLVTVYIYKSIV